MTNIYSFGISYNTMRVYLGTFPNGNFKYMLKLLKYSLSHSSPNVKKKK